MFIICVLVFLRCYWLFCYFLMIFIFSFSLFPLSLYYSMSIIFKSCLEETFFSQMNSCTFLTCHIPVSLSYNISWTLNLPLNLSETVFTVINVRDGIHSHKMNYVRDGIHSHKMNYVRDYIHGQIMDYIRDGIHSHKMDYVRDGIHGHKWTMSEMVFTVKKGTM